MPGENKKAPLTQHSCCFCHCHKMSLLKTRSSQPEGYLSSLTRSKTIYNPTLCITPHLSVNSQLFNILLRCSIFSSPRYYNEARVAESKRDLKPQLHTMSQPPCLWPAYLWPANQGPPVQIRLLDMFCYSIFFETSQKIFHTKEQNFQYLLNNIAILSSHLTQGQSSRDGLQVPPSDFFMPDYARQAISTVLSTPHSFFDIGCYLPLNLWHLF